MTAAEIDAWTGSESPSPKRRLPRMATLRREWESLGGIAAEDFSKLAACGITEVGARGQLRAARVAPIAGNLFDFSDDGRAAFIMRVRQGPIGETIDLVAWARSRPQRWRLRTGTALLLGANAASIDSLEDGELHMAPHPAAWLAMRQAGALNSCCLLDWSPSSVRLALGQARHRKIVCAGLKLAERLEAALRPPPEHWQIYVAAGADGKAAA